MRQKLPGKKSKGLRAKARLLALSMTLLGTAASTGTAEAAVHHHHHYRHSEHLALNHHGHAHVMLASAHHAYGEHAYRHEHYLREARYHHYRHDYYYGAHVEYATYYEHHYRYRTHYWHSYLQCVPYAREVSHIDLSGNAFLWWAEAAGRYARGAEPQEGAVLNFRAIGRMPLGHVAVVTSVVDARTILVTQANWVRGTITNDVTIQDVSPANDWTEVQVELGDSKTWGAAYPTYGFIYNRPADSTVIAANGQGNEVAEAPAAPAIATDAPNRDLQ